MKMKKLFSIAMAFIFGLFVVPVTIGAQGAQAAATPPPVAPELVREGDFAIELVTELNIGTTENEAEAEAMLTTSGIAPRNGWISDYPVTPDVIAEIQQAIIDAADASRLPMTRDNALNALWNVETSFDLAVVPDPYGKYAESQPTTDAEYTEPSVVNNYYDEEGPPAVTYYPPPPDYGYLYAWVPSPFWCSGFFFPGFFALNDFSIVVVANHHHHHHPHGRGVVTNHVFDPRTRTVARIDPVTRSVNPAHVDRSLHRGFATAEGKKGAAAITEKSVERARTGSSGLPAMSDRTGQRNPVSPKVGPQFQNPPGNNSGNVGTSGGRDFGGSRMGARSFSAPALSRESSGSNFGRGGSFGGFHGGGSVGGFHGGGGGRH
jgi:hypothetical protein